MATYNQCTCGGKKSVQAKMCITCRKDARKRDHNKPCTRCGKTTTNPKFCSRSCSVTVANSVNPKRKIGSCKDCGKVRYTYSRPRCKSCQNKWAAEVAERNYAEWTLGDMRGSGTANFKSRYPYIRRLSRKAYLASDKVKACLVCGYDIHFDVAHIKDVKSFPESATVAEVNHIDNLIALCKNHHWEFDNGFLSIANVSSETKPEHRIY